MSEEAPEEETAEAEASASAPSEEAPRPRRKKKRRAAAEEEPEAAPPPPRGPARPAFARDFPEDPALDALVAAFEAGDYARVRREAPALARSTESDEVRVAARALRRRIDPDPAAVYLLGIASVLLVFLAGWYWLHANGSLP
jgi:hypothetical protein